MFFKSGFLLSAYPFSAALVLAGFDMQEYNRATEAPSIPLALLGMGAVIALTAVLLLMSRPSSKGSRETEKKPRAGAVGRQGGEHDEKDRKRWAPLLTCGLFCALLLSGCSGMLQSLADGTDAVLNGLAEGTDQIAGALADMTDAALDAAADATDDSVKDAILDAYSSLVDTAGSWALTPDRSCRGAGPGRGRLPAPMRLTTRTFPARNCSLGGTTLDREAGDTVEVTCSLTVEEGEAAVFLCSGAEEPVLLLSESRGLPGTIGVGSGSVYLGVWGRGRDRERVHSDRVNCEVRHADTEKTTGADHSADRSRRDFVRQCGGCSGLPDVS